MQEWLTAELRTLDLGDKRLNKRQAILLDKLAASPKESLPGATLLVGRTAGGLPVLRRLNGYRDASGILSVVGGTSVAAPSFAGILALVEQKISSRIGNANPVIYGLGMGNSSYYNAVFHDITSGRSTNYSSVIRTMD